MLEFGPGEGWYTELLAPVLSKRGKLFVTLTDPNGSQQERSTLYGKRTQLALDSLPEAYGAVERVILSPASPALTIPNDTLDVVLLFRGAHGMFNAGTLKHGFWNSIAHSSPKASWASNNIAQLWERIQR